MNSENLSWYGELCRLSHTITASSERIAHYDREIHDINEVMAEIRNLKTEFSKSAQKLDESVLMLQRTPIA